MTVVVLRKRQAKRFLALVVVLLALLAGAAYLRSHGHGPRLGGAVPVSPLPAASGEGTPGGGGESVPAAAGATEGLAAEGVTEARLERERIRSQQIEWLERLASSPDMAPQVKEEAQRKLLELIAAWGKEAEIEGILRSKGYPEALAYARGEGVTVVLPTSLAERDAARIADAVCRVTGCRLEAVAIVAPPPR